MKKQLVVLALSATCITLMSGTALASGFRVPEQSVGAVAKAGANIASASHADASYYNPANMSWSKESWQVEGDLTYINLASVSYRDNRSPFLDGDSTTEQFLLPTFFLVSKDCHSFRFGLSATAPFGLSKRWSQPFPRSTAEEYSLSVYELNPSLSYRVGEKLSFGGGLRFLYSSATVSNYAQQSSGLLLTRGMEGEATSWGYNLAASLRPTKDMNVSLTYRSHVDLNFEGDVRLSTNFPEPFTLTSRASVELPAPAVLALSLAYRFFGATVDLTWDRTFWSEYESIDFRYESAILHPLLAAVFTPSIEKNWKDSNAYRIGLEYELGQDYTVMLGFAYDETSAPDATLGFELPDSNSFLYSLGARYQISSDMELAVAYLFDHKEGREVVNGSAATGINGEFTGIEAHLLSLGLSYDF